MSTREPMTNPITPRRSRQRWAVPALSVAIGVAYLVAGWVGGDRGFGFFGLALMSALAVAFVVLSRYSETVDGLLDRRDERINAIDIHATTLAGSALIGAVIIAFIVNIAQGGNGSPYSWLGALAGVSYLLALLFLRFRR